MIAVANLKLRRIAAILGSVCFGVIFSEIYIYIYIYIFQRFVQRQPHNNYITNKAKTNEYLVKATGDHCSCFISSVLWVCLGWNC